MATPLMIDDTLQARVTRLAGIRAQPADAIIADAIEQYVSREEQRDSFQDEAEDSWSAYQADGLHLTGEEVAEWLGRWSTETDPPACHG